MLQSFHQFSNFNPEFPLKIQQQRLQFVTYKNNFIYSIFLVMSKARVLGA